MGTRQGLRRGRAEALAACMALLVVSSGCAAFQSIRFAGAYGGPATIGDAGRTVLLPDIGLRIEIVSGPVLAWRGADVWPVPDGEFALLVTNTGKRRFMLSLTSFVLGWESQNSKDREVVSGVRIVPAGMQPPARVVCSTDYLQPGGSAPIDFGKLKVVPSFLLITYDQEGQQERRAVRLRLD